MTTNGTTEAAARPLASLIDLSGKVAVVTGAARGIGAAIASRLAEAGAHVQVADLDAEQAERTAETIRGRGWQATARALDVTSVDEITALAATVAAELGGLNIWVNNAGIFPPVPIFGDFEQAFQAIIDINLRAAFTGTREAARQMIETGSGGVVVNIVSIASERGGHPSMSIYAASKAGVASLNRSMGGALGPHGVRVVGVSPGVVLTPGVQEKLTELDGAGANLGSRAETTPLRRSVSADDIARAVLFFASDLAAFVTGQTLAVDGGDSIGGRPVGADSLSGLGFVSRSDAVPAGAGER